MEPTGQGEARHPGIDAMQDVGKRNGASGHLKDHAALVLQQLGAMVYTCSKKAKEK